MHPQLKYAYVYLKDSDQMIVKKYYINHFVAEEDKWCFIFDKSEDVFFEYPHSRVFPGEMAGVFIAPEEVSSC